MKTAIYNLHERFHEGGPCLLEVYNSNYAAWVRLGRTTDTGWEPTTETRTKSVWRQGRKEDITSRIISESGTLSFTMLEDAAPSSLKLLYGDSATTQTTEQSEDVQLRPEVFPEVYGTEEYRVAWEYGLAQADSLTVCTVGDPTATTGGTITADPYYVWVAPGYGTIPDNTAGTPSATALDNLDKTFIYATPTLATETVTVTGTELINITVTPGTDAPAADFWIVFINTLATVATATASHVVVATAGAQVLAAIANGTDIYETPNYVYCEEVTAYSTTSASVTVTERAITTDFTFDLDNGLWKRVDGGSFTNGAPMKLYYWPIESPNVSQEVGARDNVEDFRKFRVTRLGPDGESSEPETRRGEGKTFLFERVNASEMAGGLRFTEDDWDAGTPVSMNTLYDNTTSRIALVTTYSPLLANHIEAVE